KSRLEADEIPHLPRAILHAKLGDGIRLAAGARIAKADGFHRPKAQRLAATLGHLLHRHAALEVRHLVELVPMMLVRRDQCVEKTLILVTRERAVEIRAVVAGISHRLLTIPRRAKHDALVDRLVRYD